MLFNHAFDGGILRVGFFWDGLNVHTFNSRHRADRRVKGWLRRNGWAGGGMGMRLVWYHQQTTRKKEHHDSWHSQYASLFVYVSSLHLEHMTCYIVRIVQVVSSCIYIHIYNPSYLTIDIINDISSSQLQTRGMSEGVGSLIY